MASKIHILFFLYRSKVNQKSNSPVFCRITVNGQRKQFATGCFLHESDWDNKAVRHRGSSVEAKHINQRLQLIRNKLLQAYNALTLTQEDGNVNIIYGRYAGKDKGCSTLLEVFDSHINHLKPLIGIRYSPATYSKFILIRGQVKDFLQHKYQVADYPLSQLKMSFIQDLDSYLKLIRGQNENTVNKTLERVKKIIQVAIAHGWLSFDPFALYKKKQYVKEVVFLDSRELRTIESYLFSERLNSVKALFLFSCYTGLAYHELAKLSAEHIKTDEQGNQWIEMTRQKTKRPFSVLLLPKALAILQSYGYVNMTDTLLPVISNQKLNAYLKELAFEAGIQKHLTHHVARKTFASTVLLNNDVPVEVATFLLGHSKVSTTEEYYAKVQREKVVLHLRKIANLT